MVGLACHLRHLIGQLRQPAGLHLGEVTVDLRAHARVAILQGIERGFGVAQHAHIAQRVDIGGAQTFAKWVSVNWTIRIASRRISLRRILTSFELLSDIEINFRTPPRQHQPQSR